MTIEQKGDYLDKVLGTQLYKGWIESCFNKGYISSSEREKLFQINKILDSIDEKYIYWSENPLAILLTNLLYKRVLKIMTEA